MSVRVMVEQQTKEFLDDHGLEGCVTGLTPLAVLEREGQQENSKEGLERC